VCLHPSSASSLVDVNCAYSYMTISFVSVSLNSDTFQPTQSGRQDCEGGQHRAGLGPPHGPCSPWRLLSTRASPYYHLLFWRLPRLLRFDDSLHVYVSYRNSLSCYLHFYAPGRPIGLRAMTMNHRSGKFQRD
jgi:hypothetical protein